MATSPPRLALGQGRPLAPRKQRKQQKHFTTNLPLKSCNEIIIYFTLLINYLRTHTSQYSTNKMKNREASVLLDLPPVPFRVLQSGPRDLRTPVNNTRPRLSATASGKDLTLTGHQPTERTELDPRTSRAINHFHSARHHNAALRTGPVDHTIDVMLANWHKTPPLYSGEPSGCRPPTYIPDQM